jgi:hypothetical protein
MRWVGALEVGGFSTDTSRIWKDQEFPVRFNVKPLIMLEPEHGVPMEQLEGRVSFFAAAKDTNLVDGADVRVIQCKGSTSFTPKAFERLRVFGEVLWQEFQSDEATKLRVLGFVNDSHPAAT